VSEIDQAASGTRVADRQPSSVVGALSGGDDGSGDRDCGVGEDTTGRGLSAGRREAEQHPGGMTDGPGQLGVTVKLGGEASHPFGAVVVFQEEEPLSYSKRNSSRVPPSTQTP
jgi:hypothetical protein